METLKSNPMKFLSLFEMLAVAFAPPEIDTKFITEGQDEVLGNNGEPDNSEKEMAKAEARYDEIKENGY